MENEVKEPAVKYHYLSAEEYLAMERKAVEKTELHEGVLVSMSDVSEDGVSMAGSSLKHNRIISNLIGVINPFLKRKSCSVFPSDLRVYIPNSNSFTYPDITIVCGKPALSDDRFDTVLNPSVIIEVLSPSTENNDRGNKFFIYQQIESLKEYILINSTYTKVQVITKKEQAVWKFETITDITSSFYIETTSHNIKLEELYDKVEF